MSSVGCRRSPGPQAPVCRDVRGRPVGGARATARSLLKWCGTVSASTYVLEPNPHHHHLGYVRARGVWFAALLTVVGCGEKPAPAPPVPTSEPVAAKAPTCTDAAAAIERGTRDLREPDSSVLEVVQRQCVEAGWSAAAIACFAKLGPEDLARCSLELEPMPRDRLFSALGIGADEATLAIARARLAALQVGIPECDRFVGAVGAVLACEGMPIATRAQLGAETADFWSLPTAKLSADARARMGSVCARSLAALEQQAVDAGCKP